DIRAPGLSDTPILAPKPAQFRSVGAARYWPLEVRLVLLADGRSFDTIQHPAVSVGQDVEDAGPVDSHIANAPELMMEEMPLGQDAVFIEGEFCNHLAGERSYPDFGSPPPRARRRANSAQSIPVPNNEPAARCRALRC